jgi:hypothetical protein
MSRSLYGSAGRSRRSSADPTRSIKELPFESAILRSVMLWHRRFDNQPAHRWLRETVASAAAPPDNDLQSEPPTPSQI